MTRAAQIECLIQPVIDHTTQAIASGYTVYFYAAGTSTPKNVWDEKEKTTPHTSVTLGSDGTYQAYGDGIYDVVVKDGDGTTVYEWTYLKIQANTYTSQSKVANYTATPDDDVILCNGTFTVSLQDVTLFTHPIVIKNIGSGTITVDPYSTQTIDGEAAITLSGDDDDAVLYPHVVGEAWYRANRFAGLTASISDLNRISGGYLHDDDDDTKIQVEETADEDKVRIDVGGTERALFSGTVTESYVQINSHRDADGDTQIQVEETSDEDIIRFDVGGAEVATIDADGLTADQVDTADLRISGVQIATTPILYQRSLFTYNGGATAYTIKCGPGYYFVKDKVAQWLSEVTTAAIGSPAVNTWYYLYLDYSAITHLTTITNSELIWSSTSPTYSNTYAGWYNGDDRCIFAVQTDAGPSNIIEFSHGGNELVSCFPDIVADGLAPSGTFTDCDASGSVPAFVTEIQTLFRITNVNQAGSFLFSRVNGTTSSNYQSLGVSPQVAGDASSTVARHFTDSSQVYEVKFSAATTNTVTTYSTGWFLPRGM